MKKKQMMFYPLVMLFILTGNVFGSTEVWVVSGASQPGDGVDQQSVKNAFLGKPARMSGNGELKAIDRKETPQGIRTSFYDAALGFNMSKVKAYWSQMVFTGRGYPPPVSDDLVSLKKTLNETPGGISYIDPSENDASLKVLMKLSVQ